MTQQPPPLSAQLIITVKKFGNPLTYDGLTFTWQNGRQLAGITGNGDTLSFKYNDQGIRTEKYYNGVTTKTDPARLARRLAEAKAQSVAAAVDCEETLVIAADTVVCAGRELLGKPRDHYLCSMSFVVHQ
ncbi:MAG: hypothetical protein GX993_06205 [Bacteroidales bacterium]|nr:hypothetical protein [Bacteroidales bacterium]